MFVSVGNSRMDKKFNGQEMSYEDFTRRLSRTTYTAETMEQYRKMPKGQQDNVKDVGGFVLGKLKGGRRKKDCVISRSAVTLDMDYGTEGILDEIEMFFDMKMIAYSTHKHTPEKPRLRLIIFLARDVTPDEYGAVSRMLADDIGIELFDDSTYEPSRLMYWPSTSSDGEYIFREMDGHVVEPDEVLARYRDWHVLHIPGLGFDGLIGYSPIAMAKNAVGMTLACEEYGASFFANGANPGGVLEHPGVLKDPSKVRKSWNSVYRGTSNAHKIAVLEEGISCPR